MFFREILLMWNDTDGTKPNYVVKNLPQWHFVDRKSHMDWPGIEPGPLQ
jgi:hypothetical protein